MNYRLLLAIVLMGLGTRGAAVWLVGSIPLADPDDYGIIAGNLVEHGCFCLSVGHPTAFRPPLYPLLLAPCSLGGEPSAIAVLALHGLLAAVTIAGVYVLAVGWCGARGAAIAALLVAFDPLLNVQFTQIMTETLAAALTVVALLTFEQFTRARNIPSAMCAGVAVGLAILCRPTYLIWGLLLVAGLLVEKQASSNRLRNAVLFAASIVLVLTPWATRNWIVLGHPIATTTHGGYTFWLANNDSFYDYLASDERSVWSASALDERQREIFRESNFDEVAADQRYQQLAVDTIRQRPRMFAFSCAWRVLKLWHPVPEPRSEPESARDRWLRIAVAVWYVVLYAAVIVGLCRVLRRMPYRHWWPLVALLLAFTLVHAIYWSNIRMRAPLVPVLALVGPFALPPRKRG